MGAAIHVVMSRIRLNPGADQSRDSWSWRDRRHDRRSHWPRESAGELSSSVRDHSRGYVLHAGAFAVLPDQSRLLQLRAFSCQSWDLIGVGASCVALPDYCAQLVGVLALFFVWCAFVRPFCSSSFSSGLSRSFSCVLTAAGATIAALEADRPGLRLCQPGRSC